MKKQLLTASLVLGVIATQSTVAQAAAATCDRKTATIVSSASTIRGTNHRDVIVVTGTGTHTINARGGNDIICGSSGVDTINGGSGKDKIFGFAGNDILNGGSGADTISGGDGDDVESGNSGNDTVTGEADDDTLSGGTGADVLSGGAGADVLSGDTGNDTLTGGDGDDSLEGGTGADDLDGNDGVDTVSGGAGADVNHISAADFNQDQTDTTDTSSDDSEHVAPTAEELVLFDTLRNAANYLAAGIAIGDVTGTGTQTTLPSAPNVTDLAAPLSPEVDAIKHVSWDQTVTPAQGCIDGTVDPAGLAMFKVRLAPRAGHDAHQHGDKQYLNTDGVRRVTAGACSDMNNPSEVIPSTVDTALTAASDLLSAAIIAGTVVDFGDVTSATTAANASETAVVGYLNDTVTEISWNVRVGERHTHASYCISAVDNSGVTPAYFHYDGRVDIANNPSGVTSTQGHSRAGLCGSGEGGHGNSGHDHGGNGNPGNGNPGNGNPGNND